MEITGWGIVLLAGLAITGISRACSSWERTRKKRTILQGEETFAKVMNHSNQATPECPYMWGDEFLSPEDASYSFISVGAPGSGKTLNILFLMRTVAAHMKREGSDLRGLIYDSKNDLIPKLKAIGFSEDDFIIFNPFDERRWAWEVNKDIRDPNQADDFASLLIPANPAEKDSYFTDTARALLSGAIQAFQANDPDGWTFRDLICAVQNNDTLKTVLKSCRYTASLVSHFEVEKTVENVRSTLDKSIVTLKTIAASWEGVPEERRFSLKDWFDSNKLIILGNDPTARKPIQRINQVFFSSLAKLLVSIPGECKAKHWIFLDEMRELGKLDALADLMITGRSKGAAVVLGFQDLNGVFQEYGELQGREIIGCAQNISLLRLSPTATSTASWASDVAGQLRFERKDVSVNHGEKVTTTTRDTISTEKKYLPSFFTLLPRVTEEKGMEGLFFTKRLYKLVTPGKFLWQEINGEDPSKSSIPLGDKNISPHLGILRNNLLLEPWEDVDLERLKLLKSPQAAGSGPIRPKDPTKV